MRPTLTVARELLGKYLCRRYRGQTLVGRIVEVEAYLGERDPASHAYRGMTRRNEVMFLTGGHLYVYFTYGMHYCANVVTEREGRGRAALLRAIEPIRGLDVMKRLRRSGEHTLSGTSLTNGPAKLCEALSIARSQNGSDLLGNEIWIATDASLTKKHHIGISTRIGINSGVHHRWRYFLRRNPYVSRARPATSGA